MIGVRNILTEHLKDNSGSANMNALVIIAIAFVAGALLISAVVYAIRSYYKDGMKNIVNDIMH